MTSKKISRRSSGLWHVLVTGRGKNPKGRLKDARRRKRPRVRRGDRDAIGKLNDVAITRAFDTPLAGRDHPDGEVRVTSLGGRHPKAVAPPARFGTTNRDEIPNKPELRRSASRGPSAATGAGRAGHGRLTRSSRRSAKRSVITRESCRLSAYLRAAEGQQELRGLVTVADTDARLPQSAW